MDALWQQLSCHGDYPGGDLTYRRCRNLYARRQASAGAPHVAADGTGHDFTVIDQKAFLSTLTIITTALTLFLEAIAGISLVVGGIGIMNIMPSA